MKRVAIISALTALTALTATVATADTPLQRSPAHELQEDEKAAIAEVIVLFASNDGTGIDPCASHLKALEQPPLSSYDSYSCLTEQKIPLKLKTSTSVATPDKGKLSLSLDEVIPREGKKPKYSVQVRIDKANGELTCCLRMPDHFAVNRHDTTLIFDQQPQANLIAQIGAPFV